MSWILIALLSPFLHGFTNILDYYLTNNLFKNIWALIFYSYLLNLSFLPLVWLVGKPQLLSVNSLPFILIVGLIEVFYLYPYYKSLENDDTSIVASLFSLGKVFVPIFAYFFVGEALHFSQYLGFIIIILASGLLTLKHSSRLRLNRSFLYMFLSSLLLSLEAVIYKHIFNHVGWATGFFWTQIVAFLSITVFLIVSNRSADVIGQVINLKKGLWVFTLERLLSVGGDIAGTYAISLVPVTFGKSVDSTQPIFVLLYAFLLKKIFPNLFREQTDQKSVVKKSMLFAVTFIGIVLVVIGL